MGKISLTRISLVPCLQLYPVLARSLFELTVHRAKYQWYTILAVQCIKRDQNLLLFCAGKAGGDKAGCSIPSSPIHRPLLHRPAPSATYLKRGSGSAILAQVDRGAPAHHLVCWAQLSTMHLPFINLLTPKLGPQNTFHAHWHWWHKGVNQSEFYDTTSTKWVENERKRVETRQQ